MNIKMAIAIALISAGIGAVVVYSGQVIGLKNTAKLLGLVVSVVAYGILIGWLLTP